MGQFQSLYRICGPRPAKNQNSQTLRRLNMTYVVDFDLIILSNIQFNKFFKRRWSIKSK